MFRPNWKSMLMGAVVVVASDGRCICRRTPIGVGAAAVAATRHAARSVAAPAGTAAVATAAAGTTGVAAA